MHPSVVAEEPPRIQLKPPVEMNPLAKLGWQIRLNKYKPTPQEAEALGKCFEDAKWYYMNGPLAAGALMWSITGEVTRLKAFPRVLMTASAAVLGHDVGGRVAGGSCMKKILSLKGSPLRGELIAILRQDFPNHPLLKSNLVEDKMPTRSLSQPVYGTVGDMQDPSLPASHKDWATRIDDRIPSNLESSEEQESGELRRIPRIWKTEPKEATTKMEYGDADLLADPFELVIQGGYVEDSSDGVEDNGSGRPGKERRRSRMPTKERREFDRKQYQRRQQEQQKV